MNPPNVEFLGGPCDGGRTHEVDNVLLVEGSPEGEYVLYIDGYHWEIYGSTEEI